MGMSDGIVPSLSESVRRRHVLADTLLPIRNRPPRATRIPHALAGQGSMKAVIQKYFLFHGNILLAPPGPRTIPSLVHGATTNHRRHLRHHRFVHAVVHEFDDEDGVIVLLFIPRAVGRCPS